MTNDSCRLTVVFKKGELMELKKIAENKGFDSMSGYIKYLYRADALNIQREKEMEEYERGQE